MVNLVLGPCLRHVGETDATVWVETDASCEVEVLGHRAPTFHVEGHHYGLVVVEGLDRGTTYEYTVRLDGEQVWPAPGGGVAGGRGNPGSPFPPSVIRTVDPSRPFTLVFGSCRCAAPHHPPWTLTRRDHPCGREIDALYAYALRMQRQPLERWPDALLLLGDQVYADDASPGTRDFIRSRRDTSDPPGEEVADFQEYTRLYQEAWQDPVMRWLLSTVSVAMIFDDHDIHDDWNTSETWLRQMRAQPWWHERIVGGLMSYWLYQHMGNLSPAELAADELYTRVRQADDAGTVLRPFAYQADREAAGARWSYHRDFGRSRLVVIDSRCGRVLDGDQREMLDEEEWDWLERHVRGDFDHLLLATSLPYLLLPAIHDLEAWNEAVCAGAWGRAAARVGEVIRQGIDLEHWAAFGTSFNRLAGLIEQVGAGKSGAAPASIVMLSGDVHHAYLARVVNPDLVSSPVFQAVCSPVRNPLQPTVRRAYQAAVSRPAALIARGLARAARVPRPALRWEITQGPVFNNQIASLVLDGRSALLELERAVPDPQAQPRLETMLVHRLARS
ncbi:MAG: alkaline phosphatase D family protein [Actinomycetota bacterium]|nr:alkaline phosphatase D family protein [Actinomycetota bacterium]